jgi:hypothetical protein
MIFYLATIILVLLKIVGLVNWSWWFVLAPALFYSSIMLILLTVTAMVLVTGIIIRIFKLQ